MSRFYFLLWLRWLVRVSTCSLFLAALGSASITFYIYVKQGIPQLSTPIVSALWDVFVFWFPIVWSVTLLFALFRAMKYVFNRCINGYELKLFTCTKEMIERVGYGDLVKPWRKWLMLIIWLIVVQIIIGIGVTSLIMEYKSLFEWFSIYWLYAFVMSGGYLSFILLSVRCKQVKVKKC